MRKRERQRDRNGNREDRDGKVGMIEREEEIGTVDCIGFLWLS